jgi:NitT/TauT family transport system ATP-binding protein
MEGARPPALEIRGVRKEFHRGRRPPFIAVTDLNATVGDLERKGEFVCIIGPSGCGKSTLLQLVAGFDTHMPPTAGELRFFGVPISEPGADRGMLFQDYGCYPHLTVLGNVAFGLELHAEELGMSRGQIEDEAMAWLKKVRLADSDSGKYPHELSGGMRQRVALARCLALKPRCLLMDEPFSALDEPTRFDMQDLIVELWSEIEATILLVSHSVAEAVFLGDRVWLMSPSPGTIVAEFVGVPIAEPGTPAMVAQSAPKFASYVAEVSHVFLKMLDAPREQLLPIHADGKGHGLKLEGEA